MNSSKWLGILAAKILGDVYRGRWSSWGGAQGHLPPPPPPTCASSPAYLRGELRDQMHAVREQEAGQIPLVQAQLLVHWEVCPALVVLENTR